MIFPEFPLNIRCNGIKQKGVTVTALYKCIFIPTNTTNGCASSVQTISNMSVGSFCTFTLKKNM